MSRIQLIYFNAGGGHRSAATALADVMQLRPWQVDCINLMDLLDPGRQFRRFTGMAPEDLYNKPLAAGWTLGMGQQLKLLQALIRLGHGVMQGRLVPHWTRTQPDLVVSLIPNFNRVLQHSLRSVLPKAPFVTVITDLADHPPHFWIEPGHTQHLVCGTDRAVQQARTLGIDAAFIHRSSGMVLRPDFYAPNVLDRRAERQRLGLDPDRPTGVVMFGGQGSTAMLHIARQLDDVQLLLMCGHHAPLAEKLRAERPRARHAVLPFTAQVRQHLQLGDFFIGKPGPGSLSEALHLGLPVVTVRNAMTLPQERYNTDWLREQGLGLVGRSTARIRPLVLELLGRLDEFRARVAQLHNRAVFEVPELLAQILATARG